VDLGQAPGGRCLPGVDYLRPAAPLAACRTGVNEGGSRRKSSLTRLPPSLRRMTGAAVSPSHRPTLWPRDTSLAAKCTERGRACVSEPGLGTGPDRGCDLTCVPGAASGRIRPRSPIQPISCRESRTPLQRVMQRGHGTAPYAVFPRTRRHDSVMRIMASMVRRAAAAISGGTTIRGSPVSRAFRIFSSEIFFMFGQRRNGLNRW